MLNRLGKNMKALDFIIRIKNAARAQRREIVVPFSKLTKEIGLVLVKEGFLEDVKEEKEKNTLKIKIAYEKRTPKFYDMSVISRPSLKKYIGPKGVADIEKKGRRTLVISTSQGIMTGKEAQKKNLGGEILFAIW